MEHRTIPAECSNLARAQKTVVELIEQELFWISEKYLKTDDIYKADKFNSKYEMSKNFKYQWLGQRCIIEYKQGRIEKAVEFNNDLKKEF